MILNKNNATKDEEAESTVSPFVERREKIARKNSVREANAMGPKQFRTTPTTEKEGEEASRRRPSALWSCFEKRIGKISALTYKVGCKLIYNVLGAWTK